MIHPLKEEIYIAIYLIAFGIYLISTYDILLYFIKELKIIFKVIIEIIYCIIQLIITYFFSYKLATGYIPIYFIIFLIVGFMLYIYLLRNRLVKTLLYYDSNIKPLFLKIIKNVLFPFEIIKLIKNIYKKIKSTIIKCKIKRALKRKNDEEYNN